MARLIDADALFRRVSKELGSSVMYLPIDFQEMIVDSPAVDAAPVVHGRWIASDKYKGYMVCSNCTDAYVAPAWLDEGKWRYCPACGARMDGEADG